MSKKMLEQWDVENPEFWKKQASHISYQNLWFSIPALFLAFWTWMMWSIIIVEMQNLGFNFGISDPLKVKALLYSLPAIAGLAGATLRIPNSFLVGISGGRNVIFITTLLLLAPAVGTGIALQYKDTPYFIFAVFATLSGLGGGNFSSSMSNITGFFPKRLQGTALGLNAGLGNLGVSGMQVVLPWVMGFGLFGVIAGAPYLDDKGRSIFIQNSGLLCVPLVILATIGVWFGMNNIRQYSPGLKSNVSGIMNALFLLILGLIGSFFGVYLLVGLKLNTFLVLFMSVAVTLLLMKLLSPGAIKEKLNKQFEILSDKHNWIITIIYVMTFGSFIGYAASFPKLIQDVFGYLPDGTKNPMAPNPMAWAWLGPFLGAIIRPVGGWISDKVGSGSKVTAWSTYVQIIGALGSAYFIIQARQAPQPEAYWTPFFLMFMLLFIGSGIGNGSTFRSIPYIFSKEKAGPVLGWSGAIGAYGSFVIPKIFGEQIANKTPEYALYGFTMFYIFCLFLNWYFYDRKNSEIKC